MAECGSVFALLAWGIYECLLAPSAMIIERLVADELMRGESQQRVPAPLEATRRYVCSYADTLFAIAQKDWRDIAKGKQIVGVVDRKVKEIKTRPTVRNAPWPFPDEGWVSVATDGSFKEGEAGLGAVIRDHTGAVLASLHRFVPHCSDALVAEAEAALGGLKLAVDVTNLPLLLQLDCEVLVQALNSNAMRLHSL